MSDTKQVQATISPFLPMLALVFIALKLTGYIDWSWIWVLSPLWLPIAVVLCFMALVVSGFLIAAAGDVLGRRLR